MNSIRRRLGFPSPALIVAFLALSVSLGAAAYAAVKAPKNSVVSSSVKNEALNGNDIKDGSLSGAEIAGDSLNGSDIDEASLQITNPTSATPTGAAGGDLAGEYPNPTIGDGVVTAAKIAGSAVSTAKLADGSVTTGKLADGAVSNAKIADSAVSTAKIATDAVTGPKIATNAITNAELGDNAVTSSNITNGQVTGDDVFLDPVIVTVATANNANDFKGTQANCTGGRTAVGGGAFIIESDTDQQAQIALIDSSIVDADSYAANANEIVSSALPWQLQVTVVCLDI
jgi:hypothetical protein